MFPKFCFAKADRTYECKEKKVECTPETCLNGGTCRVHSGRTHCECTSGFSGHNCAECKTLFWQKKTQKSLLFVIFDIIDLIIAMTVCSPTFCKNGGNCSYDELKMPVCTCPPGAFGATCAMCMDGCKASKCLNNATCNSYGCGLFDCTCQPHYSGKLCEIFKDPWWAHPISMHWQLFCLILNMFIFKFEQSVPEWRHM